jgi:hypothetical protein
MKYVAVACMCEKVIMKSILKNCKKDQKRGWGKADKKE